MSVSPPGQVLLVDDETDLAQLFQRYLLNAGGEIAARHTEADAVEAVREPAPAVLALDLGLPGWMRWTSSWACRWAQMATRQNLSACRNRPRVQAMMRRAHLLMAGRTAVFVATALVSPVMLDRELLLAGHPEEATSPASPRTTWRCEAGPGRRSGTDTAATVQAGASDPRL